MDTELGQQVVANLSAIHRTLDVLITVGDLESAASIAKTVGEIWHSQRYYHDGAYYLSAILQSPRSDTLPDDVLVTLYGKLGEMSWGLGLYEQAETNYKTALAKHIADPRTSLRLLCDGGMAAYLSGRYDVSAAYYQQALELAQELDSTEAIVQAQEFLGTLAGMRGSIEESRDRLLFAYALSEKRGYRNGQAISMNALGELERSHHNYRQAVDYYQASAAFFGTERPSNHVLANGNLAFALLGMGEATKAQALFEQGYRHWEAHQAPSRSALCVIGLAGVQTSALSYRQAARLLAVANQHFAQSGESLELADRVDYERISALIRAHVSHDELRAIHERVAREGRKASAPRTLARTEAPALLREDSALSSREREVLGLIAQGLTDKQIGVRCHISLHTVNSHLRAIYRKLSVNSRSAALHVAHLQGVL